MTEKNEVKGDSIITDEDLLETLVVIGIILKNMSKKIMMRSLNESVKGGNYDAEQSC